MHRGCKPLGELGSKFGTRKKIWIFGRVQQPMSSENIAPTDWCSAVLSLYISSAGQKQPQLAFNSLTPQQNGSVFISLTWINFSSSCLNPPLKFLLEYVREEYINCISFPLLHADRGLLLTQRAQGSVHTCMHTDPCTLCFETAE